LCGHYKKEKITIALEFLVVKKRPETSSLFGLRKNVKFASYISKDPKVSSWFLPSILVMLLLVKWFMMAQLVEALCYKPQGRGFDS
jgi:hypothetical protein